MEHDVVPLGERHAPHNFEYADETARLAATVSDSKWVNALALQLDDGSYWRVASVSPATWEPVGAAGGTPAWADITDKPTTLTGYGITDAEPSITKAIGYAKWTGSAWSFSNENYMQTSHAANGIAGSDIANWNTAFGWGDHAAAGYTSNLGTVTAVAALTLGTSGTDVGSSVAMGTTTPVITLNIPTASAANRGALSSTDWSTFNGKQAALGFTAANVSNNLSDLTDAGTARTSLGLGTLATQSGTFSGTSSGTNTGDQATITGNAGTATALQTARTIDGVSFNGSANITVLAPATHAATGKTTPDDADEIPLADSASTFGLKKLTWANIKATLATWVAGGTIAGSFTTLASSGNTTLGDAEATDTHAVKGATTVLANSANPALKVTQTGAGNAFVVEDSASTDSTPFVIDAVGRAIVGHTAAITGIFNQAFLEIHNVAGNTAQSIQRYSLDTFSPDLEFVKSRNATTGSHTVVTSGDDLGVVRFAGSDGTAFIQAAQISAKVDGTPGTNDMPGRLLFSTTADGASSPTERMRIDSSGNVLVIGPAGLGYGTGAGGTVTQATSRTTGVTLSKPTGKITLFSTTTTTGTFASFTLTNTLIAATDVVIVNFASATSADKYSLFVTAVAAGSCRIQVYNIAAVAVAEAPVINFAVIKGATS